RFLRHLRTAGDARIRAAPRVDTHVGHRSRGGPRRARGRLVHAVGNRTGDRSQHAYHATPPPGRRHVLRRAGGRAPPRDGGRIPRPRHADPGGRFTARLRGHDGVPPRVPSLDGVESAAALRFDVGRVILRAEVVTFGATRKST